MNDNTPYIIHLFTLLTMKSNRNNEISLDSYKIGRYSKEVGINTNDTKDILNILVKHNFIHINNDTNVLTINPSIFYRCSITVRDGLVNDYINLSL